MQVSASAVSFQQGPYPSNTAKVRSGLPVSHHPCSCLSLGSNTVARVRVNLAQVEGQNECKPISLETSCTSLMAARQDGLCRLSQWQCEEASCERSYNLSSMLEAIVYPLFLCLRDSFLCICLLANNTSSRIVVGSLWLLLRIQQTLSRMSFLTDPMTASLVS